MQAVIFEVLTKAVFLIIGVGAFILWANAGFPLWIVTRK